MPMVLHTTGGGYEKGKGVCMFVEYTVFSLSYLMLVFVCIQ